MIALVLVVDDDPNIRNMLKGYMEKRNCRVLEAPDGAQAFMLAEQRRPHLITMDVMMPGLYGTSAVKRIREYPGMAGVPVIIHSGVPEEKVRSLVAFDEKTRFLAKPAAPSQIWELAVPMLAGQGYTP